MKKTLLPLLLLFICQLTIGQTLNFTNKANMPTPRGPFSSAKDGNYEYIANGFSTTQVYTTQIEKYDFVNDSWSTFTTSIPTIAKRYGNAVALSNILYLYNGTTATGLNDKLEVIELSTGTLSVLPVTNPNPVSSAGSALLGDYLLSFGGCVSEWTGNYSTKFYKIAPWGAWTALADMPVALETKGAAVYGNGSNSKLYAFGGYSQTDGLHENFETVATTGNLALANWFNVTETGTKAFQGKFFGTNKYAQISAFGATAPEQEASNVSWLISPVVPLVSENSYLTFDTKDGFDNGATLQAYIITNWTGDITTSTKTLLNATISSGHTSGYATDFTGSGAISLTGNPEYFRIAFKYTGGYTPLKTTTFQIDNVKVYNEYKSRNMYVYDFATDSWSTIWDILPLDLSAHDVVADESSPTPKIYVTGDYQNQTFLGVYDTTNGTFTPINQTNMIGRRHHSTDIYNNKLYLFGGNTTGFISSSLNSTQSADLSTLATATFGQNTAVSFYPNPATDKITFNSDIENVLLYTFEGKKINVTVQDNQLDLSHLSNGIYLIQGVKKDGSLFSDKLIKN